MLRRNAELTDAMKNKYIEIATFLLMAATVTAGFLTTVDASLFPAEWRPYLPLAIGGIIILKQLAYGVLDLLDDGKLNKSYKAPTTLLKALVWLLLPLWLCQCVTEQSTNAELRRAQAVVEEAAFGYELAELIYRPRLQSSKWSPAEKAVAEAILDKARKRLADERARLVDIQMRRAAAAVVVQSSGEDGPPANPLLPALPGA